MSEVQTLTQSDTSSSISSFKSCLSQFLDFDENNAVLLEPYQTTTQLSIILTASTSDSSCSTIKPTASVSSYRASSTFIRYPFVARHRSPPSLILDYPAVNPKSMGMNPDYIDDLGNKTYWIMGAYVDSPMKQPDLIRLPRMADYQEARLTWQAEKEEDKIVRAWQAEDDGDWKVDYALQRIRNESQFPRA